MGAGGKMEAKWKVSDIEIQRIAFWQKNNSKTIKEHKIDKLKVVFHQKFKMMKVWKWQMVLITKDRFMERTAICRDFWFVRRRNSDSLFT
jgi:hypothetical protein